MYTAWANGGWGMVMTGNVQVSPTHLTLGRDLVVPAKLSAEALRPWRELAEVIHCGIARSIEHGQSTRPVVLVQLSHAGRQSTNLLGGRIPFASPSAPSSVPLGRHNRGRLGALLHTLMFQTPREMETEEVEDVVQAFVRGAMMAAQSDFDGVELHAAHGYLIAQFISPETNRRMDAYAAPLLLLHRIVSSIRAPDVVPPEFILGIKLNSSDYVSDLEESDAKARERHFLNHIEKIASWGGVDYIQVSGGDYENPDFMSLKPGSRQALFAHHAHHALNTLKPHSTAPLVMLTGGLRTLPLMSSALTNEHAHLLGIGRVAVIHPDLPRRLLASLSSAAEPPFLLEAPFYPDVSGPGRSPASFMLLAWMEHNVLRVALWIWRYLPIELPRLIGAGTQMAWYIVRMRHMAEGLEADYTIGGLGAILRMWVWTAPGETNRTWICWVLVGVVIGLFAGIWSR